MNKRRLLKLADLLEADAKNKTGVKFDLEKWGQTERARKFVKADCGTAACAIGLAAVSGKFKKDGFTFDMDADGALWPVYKQPGVFYVGWGNAPPSGEHAVMSFFDLTKREQRFLFFPQHYPKTKTRGADGERFVAKRIRDFVAGTVAP